MTPEQLQILQHALGLNQYGQHPKGPRNLGGRNHFCAGVADEPVCRELVALGFMVQHDTPEWLPYFNCSVTGKGIVAMREASPKPPKLTRSQLRYRRFLDADCGMSFREWIDYEREVTA